MCPVNVAGACESGENGENEPPHSAASRAMATPSGRGRSVGVSAWGAIAAGSALIDIL